MNTSDVQTAYGASHDDGSGWSAGFGARSARAEDRFDAKDIVRIVSSGEAGAGAAEVCAVEGISPELYYVWRVKYGGLTAAEVERRRGTDRRKIHRRLITTVIVAAIAAPSLAISACAVASFSKSTTTSADDWLRTMVDSVPPVSAAPATSSPPAARLAARSTHGGVATSPRLLSITPPIGRPMTEAASTKATGADLAADPPGYRVQVAAVPNPEEASAWIDRLRAAGYPAYRTATRIDLTTMYRVRVGPLASHAEAEETARRLEGDGFPTPWIVDR